MARENILSQLHQHFDYVRRQYEVRSLRIFGSVARGDIKPGDLDIVVEFESKADFDRFMGLKFYLEDLLGMKVDLVTEKAVRPQLRDAINKEAITVA